MDWEGEHEGEGEGDEGEGPVGGDHSTLEEASYSLFERWGRTRGPHPVTRPLEEPLVYQLLRNKLIK